MKTKCIYCGNNQVPHTFYRVSESINILLTYPRQKFLYNPLMRFLARARVNEWLENCFFILGEALGIIRRQSDIKLCKVRRAQVLWEEAQKRGIDMQELLLFGKPIDVYVAQQKIKNQELRSKKIIFSGLPRPAGYINNWLDLMDDKWQFKKIMMQNGLPVPKGASCRTYNQAEKVFNEIQVSTTYPPRLDQRSRQVETGNLQPTTLYHRPVIVKPRAGSRGRHSTTFVFTKDDLKKAVAVAKQLCYWVMVEEQLEGPVYRATIINGRLAGVLRGDPPQVLGDGVHDISGLISIKNFLPHPGVKGIVADAGMEMFLCRQKLNLSSVLPSGRAVNLTEKIGVNYGGSSSEDFEICHPDNKALFLKAAEVLGDPIVGFDFIIPDITKSYKQQKCGFIEVNSLPFINLHHDPLLGSPRNAAALVWDLVGMQALRI